MTMFIWNGDARFQRAVTSDDYDLRVGLMLDHQSFGWLVYETSTLKRLAWGEAPAMKYAKRQSEVFVENDRLARQERQRPARVVRVEKRAAAMVRKKKRRRADATE
jgi:hypothetical protein